jgi:hypothetical protein
VSSLRLTDEGVDVMVVTLLFPPVLSRSTSVPLVEVLDKEAPSLAIFPELVPIIRGKQSSWVQKVLFQPFWNFQPGTIMVLRSLQLASAAKRCS